MSYLDKTGCEFLVNKTKDYFAKNKPQLRTFVGRLIEQTSVGTDKKPRDLVFFDRTLEQPLPLHTGGAEEYFGIDYDGFIYLKKAPEGKTSVNTLVTFQIYAYNGFTAGKKLYVHIKEQSANTGQGTITGTIPNIKYIYYIPVAAPYLTFSGNFYYEMIEGKGISLSVYSSDGKGTLGYGDGFDTHLAITTVI